MSFINKLFGGDKDVSEPFKNFRPTDINAGGLTSTFAGNSINVSANPERSAAVGGVASTFGNQANQLGALRQQVVPGFSALRDARLGEIESARLSSIGNLRENLARRRVLGSSFGADAMSRAEAEFGQQKSRAAAETFLQELEATTNLLNQEFTARRGQFQTGLDELNLEANLAAGLAGKATDVLAKNAQIESQMLMEQNKLASSEASGFGKMIGTIGSIALAPMTGGASLMALPAFTGK
jgi:hypothetical protein